MKKLYLALVLSLLITPIFGSITSAQSGYMSEEEYQNQEEDYRDYQMNKGDIQSYEVETKVAAAEEQEKKEQAEADEANKQLLIYVALGAVGITLIFFISHSWQKHSTVSRSKK
jgi:phosphate/sulfate permease